MQPETKVVERNELHKAAFVENFMENLEKRENHRKQISSDMISDKSVSGKIQNFSIFLEKFSENFRNFPTFPENFPTKKFYKLCGIIFPTNWHQYFLFNNHENMHEK